MVTHFAPDYMHLVFLGVIRQFFKPWFEPPYNQMSQYIENKADNIDEIILRVKPPHTVPSSENSEHIQMAVLLQLRSPSRHTPRRIP